MAPLFSGRKNKIPSQKFTLKDAKNLVAKMPLRTTHERYEVIEEIKHLDQNSLLTREKFHEIMQREIGEGQMSREKAKKFSQDELGFNRIKENRYDTRATYWDKQLQQKRAKEVAEEKPEEDHHWLHGTHDREKEEAEAKEKDKEQQNDSNESSSRDRVIGLHVSTGGADRLSVLDNHSSIITQENHSLPKPQQKSLTTLLREHLFKSHEEDNN